MSPYHNIATPQLCREMFFSEGLPEQELQKCYARMQDESYLAYLDMVFLDLPKPRLVKTPMLVLGAEKDGAISKREVEATARAYGTQAEFFTGMAHDMMLEAGWQSVADRMINWLAERKI